MEHRLIGRVRFRYILGIRYWFMNGHYHRDDNGPAYENMNDGYCE